jgi:hypothetical protein
MWMNVEYYEVIQNHLTEHANLISKWSDRTKKENYWSGQKYIKLKKKYMLFHDNYYSHF